jgi:hypothetical protein
VKNEEMREFLTSRHARAPRTRRVCPTTAATAASRDCAGKEVAILAGISVEYDTRLERGNVAGVSESVVEGLGRSCAPTAFGEVDLSVGLGPVQVRGAR